MKEILVKDKKTHYPNSVSLTMHELELLLQNQLVFETIINVNTGERFKNPDMEKIKSTLRPCTNKNKSFNYVGCFR